jgi:hypothetical protein
MHSVAGTPRARQDQLIVEDIDGELLVYDVARNRVHCLNRAAALIWRSCDGIATPEEIERRMLTMHGLRFANGEVVDALEQLSDKGLLASQFQRSAERTSTTRRQLLHAAAGAILVPVIVSITAPNPAQAQSAATVPSSSKIKVKKEKKKPRRSR